MQVLAGSRLMIENVPTMHALSDLVCETLFTKDISADNVLFAPTWRDGDLTPLLQRRPLCTAKCTIGSPCPNCRVVSYAHPGVNGGAVKLSLLLCSSERVQACLWTGLAWVSVTITSIRLRPDVDGHLPAFWVRMTAAYTEGSQQEMALRAVRGFGKPASSGREGNLVDIIGDKGTSAQRVTWSWADRQSFCSRSSC